MNKTEIGRHGEDVALRALKREGMKLLARNYRAGRYEIDLIMRERKTGTVVFVEVKARSEDAVLLPRTAVRGQKQLYLRRAAKAFLDEYDLNDVPCRFDVVEVWLDSGTVNRIEHAFS